MVSASISSSRTLCAMKSAPSRNTAFVSESFTTWTATRIPFFVGLIDDRAVHVGGHRSGRAQLVVEPELDDVRFRRCQSIDGLASVLRRLRSRNRPGDEKPGA